MAKKYSGENALTYIFTIVKEFVRNSTSNKVDKEAGKGLSTNDYTTAEKNKLGGIANNAQVNVLENIKVNGTTQAITSKEVNISVPTKTSQLTNDSGFLTSVPSDYVTDTELNGKGYQTSPQVEAIVTGKGYQTSTQVQTAINNALKDVTGIDFQVVTELPATGSKGVIYLKAHAHGTGDGYDEYIWVTDKYEKIGNTDIDLSGYVLSSDLVELSNTEIQGLWDSVQ